MANTIETELLPGRGIEWFAGQIPAPVQRLRYLREFAPPHVEALRCGVARLGTRGNSDGVAADRFSAAGPGRAVEKTDAGELYSNGLRIDNRFAVATHRRSHAAFFVSQAGVTQRRADPRRKRPSAAHRRIAAGVRERRGVPTISSSTDSGGCIAWCERKM